MENKKKKSPEELIKESRIAFEAPYLNNARENYENRVNKLLETSSIDGEQVKSYIEAIIAFFQDILPYCNKILEDDDISKNMIVDGESTYLGTIFKEIETHSGFLTDELRFLWEQVNHVIQPFRNIRSSIEGIQENTTLKQVLNGVLRHDIERIHTFGDRMISQLENYKELLKKTCGAKINTLEFEEHFKFAFGDSDVEINVPIEKGSTLEMHAITFQIMLDNLVSNYKKYGKNGKLFIRVEDGELQIVFSNNKKTDEERGEVLSSQVGNTLLEKMIDELCGGKVQVTNSATSSQYLIEITGITLEKKRAK